MAKSKKGSAFERSTCKLLSEWFTSGERDDIFWRTAGSGARATSRAKQGIMTADSAGDICAIHPSGKDLTKVCLWELKKGYTGKSPAKRVSILNLIDSLANEKRTLLLRWIDKLDEEVKTHHRKYWFLVFQRDRKRPVICMRKSTFSLLNKRNPYDYKFPPFGTCCDVYIKKDAFRFMRLEDFLNWCLPSTIIKKIKRRKKDVSPSKFNELVCKDTKPKRVLCVSRKDRNKRNVRPPRNRRNEGIKSTITRRRRKTASS